MESMTLTEAQAEGLLPLFLGPPPIQKQCWKPWYGRTFGTPKQYLGKTVKMQIAFCRYKFQTTGWRVVSSKIKATSYAVPGELCSYEGGPFKEKIRESPPGYKTTYKFNCEAYVINIHPEHWVACWFTDVTGGTLRCFPKGGGPDDITDFNFPSP